MSLRDLRAVREVDARSVKCPICDQPKGEPCMWVAGERGGAVGTLKVYEHAMRRRKAIRAGDWGSKTKHARCPGCGALKAGVAGSSSRPCSCPPAPSITLKGDQPGGDVA